MLKYGTFITLFLLFFIGAQGQESPPVLTTYTSADGLSLSSVNNVQSDPHGFLWIATNYGLNKFDGSHFSRFYASPFRKANGLSGNVIKQVLCDSLLTWTAIGNGGINCYFNEIDYFVCYVHDPGNPGSLVSNAVNCMLLSEDKKVYIGTEEGLSIFTRDNSYFTNIAEHPVLKTKLHITSFAQSGTAYTWIGTRRQGLLLYDEKKGIRAVSNLPSQIQTAIINDLMYDEEKNELWLATTNGLWCSKKSDRDDLNEWRQPFSGLNISDFTCVKKDTEGNLWAGTSSGGVYWRDTKQIIHHFTASKMNAGALVSNSINDIYCKADGTVWLSTPSGLQVYYNKLQRFPIVKTDSRYNNESIRAIPFGLALWKNYLVAATDKGVWLSDTNFIKSYCLVVPDSIAQPVHFTNVFIIDSTVFITGSNGVYQLILKKEKFSLERPKRWQQLAGFVKKPCGDLVKVNDSIIWLAASNNYVYIMNVITGRTDSIFPIKPGHQETHPGNIITRLYKDKEWRMLVGTNDGITAYNARGLLLHSFEIDSRDAGGKTHFVYDFYDDGKFIWVGTYGKGLLRCNRNLVPLKYYTMEDGLCDNTVYCIQPGEKNTLWLTTNRGLSIFDTASKKFTNYYCQNGLPSQEFTLFGKTSYERQTLYFSTVEGVVKVSPYKWAAQNSAPLYTMITKMMIGNEIIGRSELALINERLAVSTDYGKNIDLSFAVIDFLNSYDYTLQYKLSGNDSWLDMLSGTEIILSNLSPGTHKLYVRGIIKAENRTGEPLTLILYIKPAYYQQWWFIALVSAILILVIYGIYRYRIYQMKKIFSLRTNISQDLHDNVGAALSSISIFSQAAIQKNEKGNLVDSRNILERIGETSREVMSELNDTVWLINPRNDNLQKIIQRINNYALPLCRSNDIHFEIKSGASVENLDLTVEKRKAIYLIIKEAVNNSLKYAVAKNLIIQLNKNRKGLFVSIKDDGCGFAENSLFGGNGLNNMRQRAKTAHGKIEFLSKKGIGTEINLQVPLTNIGD
ncbi:MAG: ATP-binding protein [Ginsengibacter sp.]